MRLKSGIMNKFAAFLLLMMCFFTHAQNTCPVPPQSVVVFFGNGIDTTPRAAQRSLDQLQTAIGDTYNDQKIRYDLAYNNTSGMGADLIQSAQQAGLQWDSQLMSWLLVNRVVPAWFATWYQKLLLNRTTVIAGELTEHVEKYSTAILLGQKVVVVAHSQGNFYVNEAKKLLVQQLPAEKMKSFAVYGVAVPSNNVAGAAGPYITNHRDIIYQVVPNALPQNWKLKNAAGAEDNSRDWIQAHSFTDTYMSDAFDIKPSLVMGIKGQITSTQKPVADCTTYRPQILAMVEGSYNNQCKNSTDTTPAFLTISKTGVTMASGSFFDMNGPDTIVNLSQQFGRPNFIDIKTTLVNGASWDGNGLFFSGCGPGNEVGGSTLGQVNVTKTMMGLIEGSYQLFPSNRCFVHNGKVSEQLGTATSVVISGSTVYVGTASWDFGVNLATELVDATRGNASAPANYDPGFTLVNASQGGVSMLLEYRRIKGLRRVSVIEYSKPIGEQIVLACSFD